MAKLTAAATGVPFLGRFRSDCAQVPTKQGPVPLVTSRFVEEAHEHGVVVHVWTIDDRAEMQALLEIGVDGVMSDRPDRLVDIIPPTGD